MSNAATNMPTINVKIIRAAFREIQKLQPVDLQKVYDILRRLSLGDERHTKALKGYEKLLRTRLGNWRVIWQRESENNIVVIKVGLRGGVYDDAFDKSDRAYPQVVEELLHPQGTELADNPSYQWNHEQDADWYKFVYGSYRYSPILTDYQRNILDEPLRILCSHYEVTNPDHFEDNASIVIQSAPGTGKTVCATLFACEINRVFGWNTMLIVPEALRRDIAKFSEVKQSLDNHNFWLGTFPQWLGKINPEFDNKLASPQQELEALRQAMGFSRPTELSDKDVLLYQAFVLNENKPSQNKNVMFQANANRINSLLKIGKHHWYKALSCRLSRLDAAKILKTKLLNPPANSDCTILIIDEAQDFFLSELQAIISICKSWAAQGHQTYLWLLGDLNQRIHPTDFTWGQLQIKHSIELLKNYRNSRQILEFANQFWLVAKEITAKNKCKELPFPANPDNAFEIGDSVRLLEYASKAEALKFLEQLSGEYIREENRRYLLRDLAKAVKVLSHDLLDYHENLVVLNAERAKGREFEGCVAFCLFEGTDTLSLEESFQWYTLLTRARSRLLVVATTEELNRLSSGGHDYFKQCDRIDSQTAIKWISEVASDADLNQITDDVQQRLWKRCETGYLYWDTYLSLQFAGVETEAIHQWENQAIASLKKHSTEHLNSELKKIENISLRCLLLRAMECSWQAVAEASILKDTETKEYERLLNGIARDLEAKGLRYEEARVRAFLNDGNYKQDFPFWDEVIQDYQVSKPLVTLLCQSFTSRLNKLIENRDIV
jgi:mRNA-degrading endonuclease RelE of RelBE toxin-antitoxin system